MSVFPCRVRRLGEEQATEIDRTDEMVPLDVWD